MSARTKLITDKTGIAVQQSAINGFDISFNPDDNRFYVCNRNEFGDLETRATFLGTQKGFHNARHYAVSHKPRAANPA